MTDRAGEPLPGWAGRLLLLRGLAHLAGPLTPAPAPVCARCGAALARPEVLLDAGDWPIPAFACSTCAPVVRRVWCLTVDEARLVLAGVLAP